MSGGGLNGTERFGDLPHLAHEHNRMRWNESWLAPAVEQSATWLRSTAIQSCGEQIMERYIIDGPRTPMLAYETHHSNVIS